jgi:methylmalonyl-CoA carboxyltransferase large subunit
MNTLVWMLVSTAAGWLIGSRTTKQQIDARFREWEQKFEGANGAGTRPAPAAPAIAPAQAEEPHSEELSEEVLLVISAAVAAFLGKRARIRRVRRIPTPGFNPWSQQGRVYIQGSHNIWTRHGE